MDELPVELAYKICNKCKEKKLLYEYSRCSRNYDGLTYACKECAKKLYKSSNPPMTINIGSGFIQFHGRYPHRPTKEEISMENEERYLKMRKRKEI